MERLPYNGTWVTCGAYAFLNASGLSADYLLPVENSAGTSWGMSSFEADYAYTRILTPIREFSRGIDDVAPLWGIELQHTEYNSSEELSLEDFPKEVAVIAGPVNMESLSYLPMSRQYKLADHFIAVKRVKGHEKLLLTDSEGIVGRYVDFKSLKTMLSIQKIPEANGMLHLRKIIAVNEPVSQTVIAEYTIKKAMRNLKEAENADQGFKAFLRCRDAITETEIVNYKNSLNYNLVYVIQRRFMVERFLDSLKESDRFFADCRLYDDLSLQIEQAVRCRMALMNEDKDEICEYLEKLSDSEKEFTYHWEEYIRDGWY